MTPEAIAVAAKFGSPYEVWVVIAGHGRFDRKSGPGAYVDVWATEEGAKKKMRLILNEAYSNDNMGDEWDSADPATLDEDDKQSYDEYIASQTAFVERGMAAALTPDGFDHSDEYDNFYAIRKLELRA